MAIYETAEDAGKKARSRGQAISTGGYNPGDLYSSVKGRQYQPGQEATEYLERRRAAAISAPVATEAPVATPAPSASASADDILTQIRQDLDAKYSAEAKSAPAAQQSQGSLGGDVARAVGTGAVNLVGGGYEIGNLLTGGYADEATKAAFGKSGSEALAGVRGSIRQGESAELKAQRAELEKADGFADSFMAVVSNPRLAGMMTLEMVPQLLTVAGAARAVASKTLTTVAARQTAAGLSAEAAAASAQAAAATNATRTVLGLNAVMEAGSAGSDARQQVMTMSEAELSQSPQYNELIAEFGDTPEGRKSARTRLANEASAFSAAIAGSVSLLSGGVTGAGKLESQVLTKGLVQGTAREGAERTALGVAKNLGVAGLKETGQEALEEGGSAFASNVGVKYSGAKPNQDLLEGVPEAAGVGGALGLVSGAGFGAAGQARTALKGEAPADTTTTQQTDKTQTTTTAPSDTVRSFMSEKDFNSAVSSPEFMAAAYARADEATRGRLQDANPNLDLAALSKDQTMVAAGDSIIDGNESFFRGFNNSLRTGQITPISTDNLENVPNAPADNIPPLERRRLDQEFFDQEMAIRNQNIEDRKSDEGSPNVGPAGVTIPGLPDQDVLLRGYESRSESLMRLPETYRREQAQRSVEEMISRGFTPEQAQSVFSNPLGQAQATETAPSNLELTTPNQNAVGFESVQQRLATNDLKREPTAKPTDYLEAPVDPAIKALADRFGVQVYGFRYVGNNKTLKSRQGSSLRGGVIALNADAQKSHLTILGHELYHELSRRNPEAAKKLQQEILAYVTQPGKESFAASLLKVGYDVSKIDEEMTADVMGLMFGEKQFWAQLGQKEPSLLQKIIDVIDDMIAKFGDLSNRNKKIQGFVTDLEAVRSMLVGFISETEGTADLDMMRSRIAKRVASIDAQMQAFTLRLKEIDPQMGDTLDSIDFENLTPEEQSGVDSVRKLLSEGKDKEAAAAFKATNLYKSKGLSFNDLQKEKPKASTDAIKIIEENERYIAKQRKALGLPSQTDSKSEDSEEILFRRPQEEIDAENAYAAVTEIIDLLRRGKTAEAAKVFRESNLAAFGENFKALQDEVLAEQTKQKSEATFKEDEQARLNLKRKRSEFDSEVNKLMSGLSGNIQMKRGERKIEAIQKSKEAKRAKLDTRINEEYLNESSDTTLDNDTGGAMTQMAQAGMFGGAEGEALANKKIDNAEARKAEDDRLVAENASIMSGRVRSLIYDIDKKLGALTKIREKMSKMGYSQNDINSTVSNAENDLKGLRDGELQQIVEQQLRDTSLLAERTQPSTAAPTEYTGSNEIQTELDFNDKQRTDARRLVNAIAKKEISFDEAVDAVRKNDIGLMHLYDAMRESGMVISKERIDISGNVSVNYSLNDYVKKFPNAGLAARDSWLRAYDNLRIKGAVKLTDGEEAAYKSWKKENEAIIRRLKERFSSNEGVTQSAFEKMEDAFPNALFLNYTLNEMRNPNKIDESRRSMIKNMFDDPERSWMLDIKFVLDARPDFKTQLSNYLTKAEMQAYNEFAVREEREAQRALDMKMRSPAYSQIDGLRYLSPDVYTDFRKQIAKSEQTQLSVILHEAQRINDIAKAAKESGKDIGETIDEYLIQRMQEDEQLSQSPDQIDDSIKFDEDGKEIPPKAGVRFRRGTNSGVIPALSLEEHFNQIFSKWDATPNYTVVESPTQLPSDVMARITNRFAQNNFKGAIDPKTGHVYIFSSFAESVEDAEFTMFHELYGHWGMKAFLGDKLDSFLNNQYKLNQKIKSEADRQLEQSKKDGMPMTKIESIEEAISDLAASGDTNTFRELIGRLISWLRKHGMNTVADWMDSSGESELASVLAQARKVAMSKQGISPLSGAPTDVMYSRGKPAPAEAYAIRDGKVTGYARVNPITTQWTVFTINDGEASLDNGNYGIQQVDKLSDAHDILKKLGQVTVARNRSTIQDVDPRIVEQIPDFSDTTKWGKFKRYLILKAQNMYLPIFEVARFLESKGVENSVIDDLIKYESRLQFFVQDYERKYAVPITNSLKALGEKGLTMEDVDLFLMARHAKERNEVISVVNPKNTRGSGLSTKDAKKILSTDNDGKWKDGRAELDKVGDLIDKMSKAKLNYMLSTGLINKFQFESLSRYKHYVNLSGNKEIGLDEFDSSQLGGRSFNVRGSDIIRSTGRGTQAVDVLQNTMNSYLSVLIRGQKNVPLRAILDMFENNPDKTYVEVNPVKTQKKIDLEKLQFDSKVLKAIATDEPTEKAGRNYLIGLKQRIARKEISVDDAMAELAQRIRLAEDRRDLDPMEAARAIRRINEQIVEEGRLSPDGYVSSIEVANPSKNEVVVKVDGKPVLMTFNGRSMDFFQAITGMNIQQSGDLVDALGAWSRFFSQMVTTWNPAWIPVNAMRDIQAAIANAAADPEVGAVLAGKMMKEWKRSGHTAFKYMVADYANANNGFWGKYFKNKVVNSPIDTSEKKLLDEFFEDGAGTFFLDRNGLEQTLDKLNRHMNPMTISKIQNAKDAQVWTADKLSVVGDLMELLSMPIEVAPRFAMYKVLRDAGWDRSRAARYAKELTVNFNMKGASKWFRSVYVFANPAVQGTVRLFKDYSRGKEGIAKYMPSNRFAAVASVWMGLGWASSLIARTIGGGEDDEDKPGMDKLDMVPDYRRATSLVFLPDVYGGSIPVAYGWNVFSTAGGYAADVMQGKMKAKTAAQRTMTAAFDAFAPIGSGAESQSFAGQMAKTLAPSAAVPIVEMVMNENRFGAPLYRETSLSNVKESDAYMHFNKVNPISKWLMHSLADLTSGGKNPRYGSPVVDVNPATMDHFINSYLPGLISEGYKFAGTAINIAQGKDTKDMDIPLVGRFKAKIDEDSFNSSAFRRVASQVDTMYTEYMSPDTTAARRAEIKKDYPGIGGTKAVMSGVEQQIKKMRTNLRSFELNPINSESQKIEARNRIEKQEKELRNRAITQALKRGFRDAVVNDSPEE